MVVLPFSLAKHFMLASEMVAHPASTDFYKFYISGLRLQSGTTMYWQYDKASETVCDPSGPLECFTQARLGLHPNLNSPAFAPAAFLIARLGYETSWWTWFCISLICIFVTSWIIAEQLPTNFCGKQVTTWIFTALVLTHPVHVSLSLGQVTPILMLLTAAMFHGATKGSKRLAGFILGALICLKPFFGLFFVPLLARKDYETAACTTLAIVIIGASTGIWLGLSTFIDFTQAVNSITWSASNWNASLFGWVCRIFGGSENRPLIDAPQLGVLLYVVISMALTAALFIVNRKHTQALSNCQLQDRALTQTLPTMLLLAPLGWIYYFPLLAFCIPSMIKQERRFFQSALLFFFLAVCLIPQALTLAADLNDTTQQLIEASIYFYALAGLWAAFFITNPSPKSPTLITQSRE
ncbi:glycosyltransferase family 87 protein [Aquabacterium olei]|nr:glycosyltransferase family 87 protein [Aquabacterium olei]